MTIDEQHLAELEAIVAGLPSDPYGLSSLRQLLSTLPDPTNPDVKSARPGSPDPAPGGSGIGQALSLTSNALPGGESGGVLGVIPEIFYGQGNLAPNPVLDAVDDGVAIGLAATPWCKDWEADYDLNSGSVGPITAGIFALRGAEGNAFSSTATTIQIASDGTNAYDLDLYIDHPNSVLLQDMPILGHLVCAFRVWNGFTAMTAMTTITATVQIWDVTDGVIIAESVPFDLKPVTNETKRISCSIDAGDLNVAHPVRATLHIKAVKPAATGFDPFLLFGEPYLAFNPTQAPGPFMPVLARHEVGALAYKGAGDSQYSLLVGDLQDVEPNIKFGSGSAATDLRLRRSAAAELTIDNNGGSPAGADVIFGRLRLGSLSSSAKFMQSGTGDLVFSAAATASEAVNFPTAFDNTPVVICWRTEGTGASPKINIWASGASTTGFTANGATGDGTSSSATRNYQWLAIDLAKLF